VEEHLRLLALEGLDHDSRLFSFAYYVSHYSTTRFHHQGLRARAGLSQEELAQRVGVQQQTIAFWEQSDKPPRSDALVDLAQVLGVSVESILSEEAAPRRSNGRPKGKIKKIFEETATLPRRQQEKIAEFVSAYVNQYRQGRVR
jgi:transcriptional regulator with XRE-family HTH domain